MRKLLGACARAGLAASMIGFTGGHGPAAAQAAGAIEVEVRYGGAPIIERIKVNRDAEKCGSEMVVERVVVGPTRGLANALVSMAGMKAAPAVRKAILDQHGCKFVPHVVAVATGGPGAPAEIEIRNSDDILHNVHTYSTANPSINKSQPRFKKVMTERFEKAEIIKVTCDVHGWMLGWIAVMPHPFFGVTDASGATRIENVPAGRQTLVVWHETLGKVEKDVDVKGGQTARVTVEMAK